MFNFWNEKSKSNKILLAFDNEEKDICELADYYSNKVNQMSFLVNKKLRLKRIGAVNSKNVIKHKDLLKEKHFYKKLEEVINYFKKQFPNYLVFSDEMLNLKNNYFLEKFTIDKYIGDIPNNCLSKIEQINIPLENEAFIETICGDGKESLHKYISYEYFLNNWNIFHQNKFYDIDEKDESKYFLIAHGKSSGKRTILKKASLEVIAPSYLKCNYRYETNYRKTPPVVMILKPVFYKKEKYYLIITNWIEDVNKE